MAIKDSYDNTTAHRQDRWEPDNETAPKDKNYVGVLFDFSCITAKKGDNTGKDYASFGFEVKHEGKTLRLRRFYEVNSKTAWKLKQDLKTLCGRPPRAEQVQTADGHTGPIVDQLVGLKCKLFLGTRDEWEDLYIDGVVSGSEPTSSSASDW